MTIALLAEPVQDKIDEMVNNLGYNLGSSVAALEQKLKQIRGLCLLEPTLAGRSESECKR